MIIVISLVECIQQLYMDDTSNMWQTINKDTGKIKAHQVKSGYWPVAFHGSLDDNEITVLFENRTDEPRFYTVVYVFGNNIQLRSWEVKAMTNDHPLRDKNSYNGWVKDMHWTIQDNCDHVVDYGTVGVSMPTNPNQTPFSGNVTTWFDLNGPCPLICFELFEGAM